VEFGPVPFVVVLDDEEGGPGGGPPLLVASFEEAGNKFRGPPKVVSLVPSSIRRSGGTGLPVRADCKIVKVFVSSTCWL